MNGDLLFASWVFLMAVLTALVTGYSVYRSIKRRFDEAYRARRILPKRIVHGAVYMIFLVLVYEAVRIRVRGEAAPLILMFAYMFLAVVGIFIFGDIVATLYRLVGGGKWSR